MENVSIVGVECSCKNSIPLQNSISLANDTATFIKASSNRMEIWRTVAECTPNYKSSQRLKLLAATRWGTKNSMLKNIISTDLHLFVLLRTLCEICNSSNLDNKSLGKSCQLLTSWLSYETCIGTYLFHKVFALLDTVSKKMQEYGLNILAAMKAISDFQNDLNELPKNLSKFVDDADSLIKKVNIQMEQDSYIKSKSNNFKINIPASRDESEEIKMKMIEKVEEFIEYLKSFVDVYFIQEFEKGDDDFYEELSYLDLRNFDKFIKESSNNNCIPLSFKILCSKAGLLRDDDLIFNQLKLFNKEYTAEQRKINNFSLRYGDSIIVPPASASSSAFTTSSNEVNNNDDCHVVDIIMSGNEDTIIFDNAAAAAEQGENSNESTNFNQNSCIIDDANDFEDDDAGQPESYTNWECYCITCILKYLSRKENSKFEKLLTIYKYVAILPTTQVKCERDFSILKISKNRLRSQLSQTTLNNIMIISLCRDMFKEISFDDLVDKIVVHTRLANKLF